MKTRVAMIGCGAVGSIHAANLEKDPGVELVAAYSPNSQTASSFASKFRIGKIGASVGAAIATADVAIVCSPTAVHFEQALECVRAGVHTLVELPPCTEISEAEEMGASAQKHGVFLGCAHTARFLLPYERIRAAVDAGSIGEIQEVNYARYLLPRTRSWTDNALLHHAAHPIDLAIHWCGGLEPMACIAFPDVSLARSASILAKLPGGGALVVHVSYSAKLPHSRMVVVGTKHTIETDGFSYLRSDLEDLNFAGNELEVYEQAIGNQDTKFLAACRGTDGFVPWSETLNLIRVMKRLQALSGS
jgi:2-hydroxy-4-carboxymuconate semialdehyde hemiacetal dehydrogenase